MPDDKSPDNGRLIKKFYRFFWDDVKATLIFSFQSISERWIKSFTKTNSNTSYWKERYWARGRSFSNPFTWSGRCLRNVFFPGLYFWHKLLRTKEITLRVRVSAAGIKIRKLLFTDLFHAWQNCFKDAASCYRHNTKSWRLANVLSPWKLSVYGR